MCLWGNELIKSQMECGAFITQRWLGCDWSSEQYVFSQILNSYSVRRAWLGAAWPFDPGVISGTTLYPRPPLEKRKFADLPSPKISYAHCCRTTRVRDWWAPAMPSSYFKLSKPMQICITESTSYYWWWFLLIRMTHWLGMHHQLTKQQWRICSILERLVKGCWKNQFLEWTLLPEFWNQLKIEALMNKLSWGDSIWIPYEFVSTLIDRAYNLFLLHWRVV